MVPRTRTLTTTKGLRPLIHWFLLNLQNMGLFQPILLMFRWMRPGHSHGLVPNLRSGDQRGVLLWLMMTMSGLLSIKMMDRTTQPSVVQCNSSSILKRIQSFCDFINFLIVFHAQSLRAIIFRVFLNFNQLYAVIYKKQIFNNRIIKL